MRIRIAYDRQLPLGIADMGGHARRTSSFAQIQHAIDQHNGQQGRCSRLDQVSNKMIWTVEANFHPEIPDYTWKYAGNGRLKKKYNEQINDFYLNLLRKADEKKKIYPFAGTRRKSTQLSLDLDRTFTIIIRYT